MNKYKPIRIIAALVLSLFVNTFGVFGFEPTPSATKETFGMPRPFIFNSKNGKHFIQIKITFEPEDTDELNLIKTYVPFIESAILKASKSYPGEFDNANAKEELLQAIKDELRSSVKTLNDSSISGSFNKVIHTMQFSNFAFQQNE